MDASTVLSSMADAALIVGLGMVALLLTAPYFSLLAGTVLLVWLSRKNNTQRRFQNWYIWFPIQRQIHRLYIPHKKRIRGLLMCRVKKSVVADKLDECLHAMVVSGDLNRNDYRELCVKIGIAISCADLIPKGKRSKAAIRRIVEQNCKDMRESLAQVGRVPGKPEPKPAKMSLSYLRNRSAA